MSERLQRAIDRRVALAQQRQLIHGVLGRINPADDSVTFAVAQRPDFVHVRVGISGQLTPDVALNRGPGRVPLRRGLPILMRRENETLIIVGEDYASGLLEGDSGSTGNDYGVTPHPIAAHSDMTETSAAVGDVIAHDGSGYINEAPVATSAGAGDAGKLVRLDGDGNVDVTMIAAADIAAKIDAATVSSSMTTTDKIAAVIGGVLRYFTYQTIRDAIKSYYDSVVATLTNKSIDASANTLTNVNTSALADDAASNAKLANMAQDTIKGRASGAGTGDPTDLSASQVLTILTSVIAAAFWTFTNKIVIAATATSGSALKVIRNLAAASTDSPVMDVVQDNPSDDQHTLRLQQDGTGALIICEDDGTEVLRIISAGSHTFLSMDSIPTKATLFSFKVGGSYQTTMGLVGAANQIFSGSALGDFAVRAADNQKLLLGVDNGSGSNTPAIYIVESGYAGFGVADPQGPIHGDGFLEVKKTSVNGTKQVIIPNATGDVTMIVTGFFTLSDGTSSVANSFTLAQGGTMTLPIALGGSTWTITLNANGELSVQRTAGSGTGTMTFKLTWI